MIFGRKRPQEKALLILDVESGSVGASLARVSSDGTFSLLGESRLFAPVRPARSAESLAAETSRLLGEAALKMSELAARLRHEKGLSLEVSGSLSVMAPPWGTPNIKSGQPEFNSHMQESVKSALSPYFDTRMAFVTSAGSAVQGMRAVAPEEEKYLLCIVTHEMTELLLVYHGAVVGHATLPHGVHLPLRTLKAHGGLSDAEARSLLKLGSGGRADAALSSATEQYAEHFKDVAKALFGGNVPEKVWVVSPAGEYFARALSHPSLAELFPRGGVVRAVKPHHLHTYLGSQSHDVMLLLGALWVLYTDN